MFNVSLSGNNFSSHFFIIMFCHFLRHLNMMIGFNQSLHFNVFLSRDLFKDRNFHINTDINFYYFLDRDFNVSSHNYFNIFFKNGINIDGVFDSSFYSFDLFNLCIQINNDISIDFIGHLIDSFNHDIFFDNFINWNFLESVDCLFDVSNNRLLHYSFNLIFNRNLNSSNDWNYFFNHFLILSP